MKRYNVNLSAHVGYQWLGLRLLRLSATPCLARKYKKRRRRQEQACWCWCAPLTLQESANRTEEHQGTKAPSFFTGHRTGSKLCKTAAALSSRQSGKVSQYGQYYKYKCLIQLRQSREKEERRKGGGRSTWHAQSCPIATWIIGKTAAKWASSHQRDHWLAGKNESRLSGNVCYRIDLQNINSLASRDNGAASQLGFSRYDFPWYALCEFTRCQMSP